MKILLAEDDKGMMLLLETSLRKRGYSVEIAMDGKAALEKALAAPPDLIVSDVMMPELDGFMLCRLAKAESSLAHVPVILYTATRSEAGEEELARQLGAARFVLKTDGVEPLLAAIKEVLENSTEPKPGHPAPAGGGEEAALKYVSVLSRKLGEKERELRRERDQEKMYLDIAGVMLVALDAEGRITLANKKCAAILGYGEGELIGKNWFDTCLPEEVRTEVRGVFEKIMAGDIAPVENYENAVLTKSGQKRAIFFHNAMIRCPAGEIAGVLFSGLDITAQRQAEEALLQAQKLDSIGLLSAGIAHDLNNLLGPILAYADFLRKSTPQGSAQQEDINEISKAAGRAAELVRQLLAFSRRQKLELKVLDLNAVIKGLDGMLRRILGEKIVLAYALDPAAGPVKVDLGQMEQVVVNLALNAREAMPEGGRLTVTTVIKDCPAGDRRGPRSFTLTVADTGCGMAPEVLRRVFEPFFTTKGAGRGMGLGLSAVYGIVKQSGGEIHADSAPGKGSAFTICLPLEQAPAAAAAGPAPQSLGAVLVVEDDETMLRISKRILSGAGYKVLEAVNGKEALKVLEQNAAGVSVVLTDLRMPELDGVGLAKEALAKYPGIKILCMSGYEDKQGELVAELGADTGYLQKPFTPDALLDKVAQVLARK